MNDCTHAYIACLTFDDAFMEWLGARLAALPRLRTIATLKRFPTHAATGETQGQEGVRFEDAYVEDATACRTVEVTWGAAVVHVYRRRDVPTLP